MAFSVANVAGVPVTDGRVHGRPMSPSETARQNIKPRPVRLIELVSLSNGKSKQGKEYRLPARCPSWALLGATLWITLRCGASLGELLGSVGSPRSRRSTPQEVRASCWRGKRARRSCVWHAPACMWQGRACAIGCRPGAGSLLRPASRDLHHVCVQFRGGGRRPNRQFHDELLQAAESPRSLQTEEKAA